jgi:hypothetical protein
MPCEEGTVMGKTQVSEKDRPDLERLEQIVKDAGHAGIGTAELSEKSGITPAKIRSLLNRHFSRAFRSIDPKSKAGIPADLWVYKPTAEDIATPHRSKV